MLEETRTIQCIICGERGIGLKNKPKKHKKQSNKQQNLHHPPLEPNKHSLITLQAQPRNNRIFVTECKHPNIILNIIFIQIKENRIKLSK